MAWGRIIHLRCENHSEITTVEIDNTPIPGEFKMISPTEIIFGPDIIGLYISIYIPYRNLIYITKEVGLADDHGYKAMCFEYRPARPEEFPIK